MADLLLGTSGWSYEEWIGPFYKDKRGMLEQYCECFRTVEVDSTFYRYPNSFMVSSWAKRTPRDFRFALKIPQLITHDKALDPSKGVAEDLNKFLQLLEPLRESGKLGPLLLQMGPSFTFDAELLDRFFHLLPDAYSFAIEFRHPSWLRDDTYKLLRKHRVAYTCVDEPLLPPDVTTTNHDFAYVRWHGKGTRPWYNYRYSQTELQPWTSKVESLSKNVEAVYGYFNNHFHGYAVVNSLEMMRMVIALSDEQQAKLEFASKYLEKPGGPTIAEKAPTRLHGLDQFLVKPSSVEELLESLMDRGRLERSWAIQDAEFNLKETSPKKIVADVRGYSILIELDAKRIRHNCDDWTKSIPSKRFCKHIGALFLRLPTDRAVAVLRQISSNKEVWVFEQD